MLKSHEKFHSANGKRQLLIADDEWINRELLGAILAEDYEVLFAADGQETLRLIRENSKTLSLVLLDLMMPGLNGLELLRRKREDPDARRIPVIVMTADQEAEVESLTLGAIDFIPKPYPPRDVILARIRRTIELSEDRQIIQSTERDPLTGLYNREYFYRYAEQFDQHHPDLPMDAIVVDINHFHMINERFGNAYGDAVLRGIGEHVRSMVADTDGIVCRREADTFMVYCPHGKDYQAILESAAIGLIGEEGAGSRVHLRLGVYENVDKDLDIERRFDRAKLAADTVRGSFARAIGIYDNALHEHELYTEQMIESFRTAIDQRQFTVFYQPKFDVRPEIPVLSSAEALVRWRHPELGMVSPGVFIPIFEENGLIQELDHYVWETAAAQIRSWKERFGFSVPVSVNVSRIDMYDPKLIERLQDLLSRNGLGAEDLYLEITESAYTQDSEQIIETVNSLRELGFRIEMDDFGTGYSSLNMISSLPIDALKLDMQFIRAAFAEKRDTRLLELIIDVADYLDVPVIAEGVETEEQLNALKAMGCDLVQGYYFSRPVPAEEYEAFVLTRRDQAAEFPLMGVTRKPAADRHDLSFGKISYALSSGFESVYYVDTESNYYVQFSSEGKYEDLQIERSGADFFADTRRNVQRVVYPPDIDRVVCAMDKETLLSRLVGTLPFSMTYRLVLDGSPAYYSLKAVRANIHDDHHIVIGVSNVDAQVKEAHGHFHSVDFGSLARALAADYYCIYCVDPVTGRYLEYGLQEKARPLSLGAAGDDFFDRCRETLGSVCADADREAVRSCLQQDALLHKLEEHGSCAMPFRVRLGGEETWVNLKITRLENEGEKRIVAGIHSIDAQVRREQELNAARQLANRDALTGVKSKHAFDEAEEQWNQRIAAGEAGAFAVAVCDVNGLKMVNDTRGHLAGDRYLQDACRRICETFKHSPVFRIGGDEFAVILSGQDYANRAALLEAFAEDNRGRAEDGGQIACGMAEAQPGGKERIEAVFVRADAAMYENKKDLKTVTV